jgi:hypothetical protein
MLFAQFGQRDKNAGTTRILVGFVTDRDSNPIPQALVYLKNTKTQSVKTYIAEQDGSYRFHQLSPNVDYEVHAEKEGRRSDTKTLSSFDTRPQARINLKLEK